jgi:hypothetical protein
MDQARVETGVDAAVSNFGVTGAGVIVAIMDRGIDWQNNDFRNPDGSTRIAAILDLTDDRGSNAPANPYGLGTLYTRQQINDALTAGTNLVTRDAVGHGTTTTGIACGCGRNLWKYRGVAYNATIVVVKFVAENVPAHDNQPAEMAFYDLNRLPVAIHFVQDQAKALGLPAVMLLNIGSIIGPMDGTSKLCQTINQTVGPGIPGLVIVTGPSDDGSMPNHAAGTVAQNGTASIQINKGDAGALYFDLWYAAADRFNVTVQSPSGTFGPYLAPSTSSGYDIHNMTDFLYYQLGGNNNFYSTTVSEREIWIELTGPIGQYTVTLTGAAVSNGHFKASLSPSRFWDTTASSNYFTSYVVPGYTIWDLASATNNICPNDYVHRTNWVDIDGISRAITDQGGLGELWKGTGVGPTFDGRVGIDVSAPGDCVFTTYNTNSYWETSRFNLVQDGMGLYGRASATSAANPIVTGIVALMLQMNPRLDAPMVKRILQQSASVDTFTGAVPNAQFGYGKVNASNAVAMVRATLPVLSVASPSNQLSQVTIQQAVPGWHYVLQTSSNLVSWTPLLNSTASTNSITVLDTNAVDSPRYYRALIQ